MKIPAKVQREEGAAAVEFAIIASVLVMLVFGMMQFGLAFFQTQNLRAAVREGARVAAVRGAPALVKQHIADASAGSLSTGNFSYTQSITCDDGHVGEPVTITISQASLPASVREQFSINIPFGPKVVLDPQISGSFRCE